VRLLLHKEVQDLTALLQTLVDAFQLYNDQKPEINRALLALLDRTAATYRERGRADKESQTASLKAEILTALRGVNPLTLEKAAVRRHEMQSSIVFKVLQSLESQLRDDFRRATESLQRAQDLVSQILIASIQKGLLTDAAIHDTTTQTAIEALWRSIAEDPAIAVAQKQVLMQVSVHDAYLLIDLVLAALREAD